MACTGSMVTYSVWRPKDLRPILLATLKESTMLMFIIGMSLLYSYVMSYLHISQSAAAAIVAALREVYFDVVRGNVPEHAEWRTLV